MAYVEWLRVRRRLITYFVVLAVLTALCVLPAVFGHVYTDSQGHHAVVGIISGSSGHYEHHDLRDVTAQLHVPLSALFGLAGFISMIFATTLATSLNAQHESLNLAFTRPISREKLALTYFAVDAAGIAVCFVVGFLLVCLLPFVLLGILDRIYADSYAPLVAFVGIGASLMFYGLLQGATAWARGGTGLIVGLAWPILLLAAIPGTPPFGPVFNAGLTVIRSIDPVLYLRDGTYLAAVAASGPGTLLAILLAVWAIGIAGCALATFEWRRLEV